MLAKKVNQNNRDHNDEKGKKLSVYISLYNL